MSKLYIEDDIAVALNAIVNGVLMRKAALEYGIPYIIFQSCINGCVSYQKGSEMMQKIASIQERRLVEWILVQESLGISSIHWQIREIVERFLDIKELDSILGKRWVYNFLERNPEIRIKRQYRIDSARVSGAFYDIIVLWFRKLELPEIIDIKPQNRYNMDDAGIMEGQGLNGLVVGNFQCFYIQKKQSGSRVWISFIECISATGRALKLLVIFKGKTVQQ
ncbi:transposase [Sclerotinia borealis F-4128]|uniref:Transposase n=1 Tax=Sclerotinia borealis (strain F-4128) TaxID=1432307 RepID=W9CLL7_SCLBF|nr:transposase [Sclerotinia borealis F-4128]